jgi:hypothetical protein
MRMPLNSAIPLAGENQLVTVWNSTDPAALAIMDDRGARLVIAVLSSSLAAGLIGFAFLSARPRRVYAGGTV